MKHANISLFVPHVGCLHRCSFCNQTAITGEEKLPHVADVEEAVAVARRSKGYNPATTEIAFFGGSFTAIDPAYRTELLEAASRFVKEGAVSGIRLSTRPDAIDDAVLTELKQYGVTAIELGAQSMDDTVLACNGRGHTAADVEKAAKKIKKAGFELGLQMMTGLYGSSHESDIETAEKLIKLAPDTVRIYPTVILKGTVLGKLWEQGQYQTDDVASAVDLCATLLAMFHAEGIRVIRLGLHTVKEEDYLSGPWHPAFRELCESELYYRAVRTGLFEKGKYILTCHPKEVSKVTGQSKDNLRRLWQEGFDCTVKPDESLAEGECKIIQTEETSQ